MRLTLFLVPVAAAAILAACSSEPQPGSAAANADAVADQLEAKANNYAMLADNTTDSANVIALDNTFETLDQQSANVRAAANPREKMK